MDEELKRIPCKVKPEHTCSITAEIETAFNRAISDSKGWNTKARPIDLIIKSEDEYLIFLAIQRELVARKSLIVKEMINHIVGGTSVEENVNEPSTSGETLEDGELKKKKKRGHH
jgi:hypothetical protein